MGKQAFFHPTLGLHKAYLSCSRLDNNIAIVIIRFAGVYVFMQDADLLHIVPTCRDENGVLFHHQSGRLEGKPIDPMGQIPEMTTR